MSQRGSIHCKWRAGCVKALLLCVLLMVLVWAPVSNAAKMMLDEKVELQRSLDRYREYFVHRKSMRGLLQHVEGEALEEETARDHRGSMPELIQQVGRTERDVDDNAREDAVNEEKQASKDELYFLHEDPYRMGLKVEDWDHQRASWLHRNHHLKSNGKPQVLIVTGSQPGPCKSPEGDHFHIRALKNKMDYARMHNFQIFNNFVFLDPLLTGVWAKLPIARNLMLTHPEIEWLLWVDSDALFTDMLFEIPFDTYDDYNMVMWAWHEGVRRKDWVAVNDGVFLLRNCQWSLDLFDKWSPMGKNGDVKVDAGIMLSSFLTNRRNEFPADDQSALMYVMLTDDEVMKKVKLVENEYVIHGYWVDIVDHFEELMENYHPGLGDCRWPLTTHFTGCGPCSGANNPDFPLEMCMRHINRALNFADNQVLAYMGYRHEDLASPHVVNIWNETTSDPLKIPPPRGNNPWSEKIAQVSSEKPPACCGPQKC